MSRSNNIRDSQLVSATKADIAELQSEILRLRGAVEESTKVSESNSDMIKKLSYRLFADDDTRTIGLIAEHDQDHQKIISIESYIQVTKPQHKKMFTFFDWCDRNIRFLQFLAGLFGITTVAGFIAAVERLISLYSKS